MWKGRDCWIYHPHKAGVGLILHDDDSRKSASKIDARSLMGLYSLAITQHMKRTFSVEHIVISHT